MTAKRECCDSACNQGRDCPLRTDRRAGPTLLWTLVSWLVPEWRSSKGRRLDVGTVRDVKRRTG